MCRSDLHTKGDKVRKQEKKLRVYVDFIDLEKAHSSINKEALWQVLRIYNAVVNF